MSIIDYNLQNTPYNEQEQELGVPGGDDPDAMTLTEFTEILLEIRDQPVGWRTQADRQMDYRDGNQLDSQILEKMGELGIPPAVEPLIGLAIEQALGAEKKKRTDFRIVPRSDKNEEGQLVADAFNQKLNETEKHSRADRACSDAYDGQYSVGVGWVEVTRNQDPFAECPYRCIATHRNEVFWDWSGYQKDAMGREARFLLRKKWIDKAIAKTSFPDYADLLEHSITGWSNFDIMVLDGGRSTGLYAAQDMERGWTIEEQEWRNINRRRIQLFELWYRRWNNGYILRSPDGRIVEFDMNNEAHFMAVQSGMIVPEPATLSKVRRAWFAGPHKLADEPSPYQHKFFGYVPFWGHREDRTGVPYGRIKGMMYMQDNINASMSKIRWGLGSTRTIRTDGAYKGSDAQLRNEVSRQDADIVLNAERMAQPGARFEVNANFELNEQQYKMLVDSRQSIEKLGNASPAYMGQTESQNAAAFAGVVEQANQGLANIDDNFAESRTHLGEILLSMLVQDSVGKPETVTIDGQGLREDKTINLNEPVTDEMGYTYLNNDVERVMLKVELEEVPSTSSYRNQQLAAFSEAYKASPPEVQNLFLPHMIGLMDLPNKQEIIKALKELNSQPSVQQQELQNKAALNDAQIKLLAGQLAKVLVETQYSASQTGLAFVQAPAIAPVVDKILENSDYPVPNPPGPNPGFSNTEYTPQEAQQQAAVAMASQPPNLHPGTPESTKPPPSPNAGQAAGIETLRGSDNTQGMSQ